ncbi:insulin-degrading enzyme [Gymnopus androsaceus JB14]|uniref:Insulin-degrading enzyme n=1 Tax=Gymnopus androsaceus JB14 TaxID=1447944 RepID=A0A6A4H5X0_9AGAR|nr:insulin-degrading enzyme [Gymnopus androsaceus JB14]
MAAEADWRRVDPTQDGIPPFSVFTKPMLKSPQDDREYRRIRLENGLEAVLIHDSKADSAAASLDVAVGHLSDPHDMPGLAHFCEHLLFMGTEHFPKENEYSEFLAKNNGGSNAYTATSNTNYHFSVATSELPEALARFSAFFHCPLFAPSCTSRELNAVDSEHKKNHQNDLWRISQVSKHLSKPGHVWNKFGSGNRESLSQAAKDLKAKAPSVSSSNSEAEADGGAIGRETRRRLVEWWTKEYCASRMHLAVLGKESLDELAELASKTFSPIPNRQAEPLPMIYDHPFGPDEKGTMISVPTIMTTHAIEISLPIEYQALHWRHKPSDFICHFVEHEGPGSLFAHLKKNGWVTELHCDPQSLGRGFDMFTISIELTKEGFNNFRSVILTTFKYLSLLRSSNFKDYHQRECAILSDLRFRFLEKHQPDYYVTAIAEAMTEPYPYELLLAAATVTAPWGDEYPGASTAGREKVYEYLEQLKLENGRIMLMAKGEDLQEVLGKQDTWEVEPWYGTLYCVERFDEEFLRQTSAPNDLTELFLPGPNEFIPTNLDIDRRENVEPVKRPHMIRETPLSTVWHKKDDRFWVPKARVMIDIRSPVSNSSSRSAVLTGLFTDLVDDSLSEFSYDASLTGLSYNCYSHTKGIFVTLQGYNDKMSVLVRHVLEKVKNLEVLEDRMRVMIEQNKQSWENFFLQQSYQLSEYYVRYLMTKEQWTAEEYLKEFPTISAEEISQHAKALLSNARLRILVSGNVYKDEAIKIAEMAESGLGGSSMPDIELNDRALVLPQGCNLIKTLPIPNPNEANSALTYFVRIGSISNRRLCVTGALLSQILTEPAFNFLRTKEQLGYIVSCSYWHLAGDTERGIRIVVQSEKTPGYLESRVEAFLEEMKNTIEVMTLDTFEEQKSGLDMNWREEDKSLAEEASVFMSQINTGHLDFYKKIVDADVLKDVTKEEVYALFMSHVHPSSKTRSKLSVQMSSQKVRPKRVSAATAEAFEGLLRDSGVDNVGAWREKISDETPTVEEFQKYWAEVLAGKEGSQGLLQSISQVVQAHPVAGEGPDPRRSDVTYIGDMKEFRAGLQLSENLGAIVQWGDLPVSKLDN